MLVACSACHHKVHETAPACPHCGNHVYIEHPGDIRGVKHAPLSYPRPSVIGKLFAVLAMLTLGRLPSAT